MPKIIENLRQTLLDEARSQVLSCGYSAMTIRSVAKACGVSVGAVYNYFPSKDTLIATFMLDRWQHCLSAILSVAQEAPDPTSVLRCIYDQLVVYLQEHRSLFRDEAAAAGFAGSFSKYHGLLRSQLAAPLLRFFPDAFTCDFIAEALLTWTVAGKGFEEQFLLIQKLYKE